MAVRQRSKHELVAALQTRYGKADPAGKARWLDEFCAATGYHRKHAIRVLRQGPPPPRAGHGGRARVYSAVVIGALRLCAEASGWLCGKRLAPFLAELVPALEAEGALRLEPLVRSQLLAMSAATIDRRLRPYRLQLVRGFGATKPGSLLKSQVPIRTWTPWDEQRVGFLEIDLVAHCGINNAGQYLYTLVATDVASGWTECMGVPSKRQDDVFIALEAIRSQLPFVLLGLDSDNGSEFLNGHLVHYCQLGAPPHLHPFTPILEKRPGPRRAEKLVDRAQGDRLRPLRGRGRSGAPQSRVRDPPAVDQSLAASDEARG